MIPPAPPPPPPRPAWRRRLASGLLLAGYRELRRPLAHPQPVVFELPPGLGFRAAARRLHDAGLIGSPRLLELYARLAGHTGRIKSGVYRFAADASALDVLARLCGGVAGGDRALTLPEGLTRWEVAARLEQAGIVEAAALLPLLDDEQEGRLFPDTYRFFPQSPPADVLATLRGRFDQVFADLRQRHPQALAAAQRQGLGERELVTLASLIEKEAQVAAERPVIARVFYNRLARQMRLQSDPTCVYGAQTYREVPSPRRCHDPANRYSTYVHAGLPPTPIANPGRGSLQAALAPSDQPEHADLLFFVARRDGTGRHDFSRTGEEHARKVELYLRHRPAAADREAPGRD